MPARKAARKGASRRMSSKKCDECGCMCMRCNCDKKTCKECGC